MFKKLWNDDCGAIISTEWILFTSVLTFGTLPGLMYLRDSYNQAFRNIGDNLSNLTNQNVLVPPTTQNINIKEDKTIRIYHYPYDEVVQYDPHN